MYPFPFYIKRERQCIFLPKEKTFAQFISFVIPHLFFLLSYADLRENMNKVNVCSKHN